MDKYFLDKRFLVNGKKSHIYLDNFLSLGVVPDDGLPCQVLTYTGPTYWNYGWNYLNTILTATNGLNYSTASCPNLLKLGGNLIEDTIIDGVSTYALSLLKIKEFYLTSDIASLAASVDFYIQTPNVINSTAVTGQVLQLIDSISGKVEYATVNTSVLFDNAIYVSENGNDLTGAPYDMTKPYRNVNVAMTAAVAGDIVVVYPGSYSIPINERLIKTGVNLYLMKDANVNINEFGPSTITFNGRHGIYGNGTLTLSSLASNAVNIFPFTGTASDNYITIELDNLNLNKVIINYFNYKELNVNIQNITVQSTWVCPLRTRSSASNSVCNFNIGSIVGTVGVEEGVISVNDTPAGGVVNIKVNNIQYPFLGRNTTGLIYTANSNVNSTINIDINKFIARSPTNLAAARMSLIGGAICNGYKNININDFTTTGRLYGVQIRNSNITERGIIKLKGTILNYTVPLFIPVTVSTENILMCTKRRSALVFDLDVLNESVHTSNALLAYKEGMIRIDSEEGLQKITGYIKVSRTSNINSPNCVVYSLANVYSGGAETGTCATLDNFTIVSAGVTSIKNNTTTLNTAKIPVKNVYSNIADNTTQIDYKVEAGITVDTYVR
jgi:hypothetical protein